jgi:multiple sugar transport system permease protein
MRRARARTDAVAALAFLAPNFVGFLVFTAGPVLFSLVVSFSNWNLQRTLPFQWIALENFRELFADREFWFYFFNTLYMMLGVPVAIAGSLAAALLLSQKLRGMIVYRTLFYLPTFTAGVALMILWKALYNPDFGPINAVLNTCLHAVGLDSVEAPRWLGSMANLVGLHPEATGLTWKYWGLGARDALILMGVWTAIGGNNMLLYLAALSNVPQELHEAAQIDGAGKWATFRHVTWPQLAPTTFFIVIMSVIGGLQGGFEQARVLTQGGPAGITTTLAYYIYNKAFIEFQIGYASAVAWVLFMLIFAFTLVHWKLAAKELNY